VLPILQLLVVVCWLGVSAALRVLPRSAGRANLGTILPQDCCCFACTIHCCAGSNVAAGGFAEANPYHQSLVFAVALSSVNVTLGMAPGNCCSICSKLLV